MSHLSVHMLMVISVWRLYLLTNHMEYGSRSSPLVDCLWCDHPMITIALNAVTSQCRDFLLLLLVHRLFLGFSSSPSPIPVSLYCIVGEGLGCSLTSGCSHEWVLVDMGLCLWCIEPFRLSFGPIVFGIPFSHLYWIREFNWIYLRVWRQRLLFVCNKNK